MILLSSPPAQMHRMSYHQKTRKFKNLIFSWTSGAAHVQEEIQPHLNCCCFAGHSAKRSLE
jgi:hypothetical protein